jgi:hypothetical protein
VKLSGLLLASLLLTSCAASSVSPAEPWRIEVTSSGGLAGRGAGTYAVASDGTVSATLMNGASCTFNLTPSELARVKELLGASKRPAWSPSYVPDESCCDRFSYRLTVDEAGAVSSTHWIDQPLPMPADLEALSSFMVGGAESIRAMSAERCR